MRVLKLLFSQEKSIFPSKLFIEKKQKKIIIINKKERMDMLYEIFHLKDMNLILIWYFSFYLGLSLEEASNITTENILFFKNKLYFIRNEKIVFRNIIDKIIMIINKLIIINNLNQRDYLLCFNIKGNKNINRKD